MSTAEPGESDREAVVLAFMIADIRGYSRFSREYGDAAAAALAKRFADLARDAVEARGGTVVELRGDEALATFPTPTQAIQAAVDFQLTCIEESQHDPSLPLLVGVGIDVGPAIPVEDGYRGIAINLAARLCSAAGANQVLVTAAAAEQAAAVHKDVELNPRGAATFKGFEEPVSLVEAHARWTPASIDEQTTGTEPLPAELLDAMPLVGRVRDLSWLRGTWRQVRRGRGRVVAISGPVGIGKTRLATEIATHVQRFGGGTSYAGPGGPATADALAAVALAREAETPSLVVIDQFDILGSDAVAAIIDAVEDIESRPVLMLLLLRDPTQTPALAELVDRCAAAGGHRRLAPLTAAEVADVVALYAGDASSEAPVEMIVRASRGVPALVHEQASEWARSETSRRLEAAAAFMTASRDRRASDLEFANNVIGLKLGRLYAAEGTPLTREVEALGPYKGLASFEQGDAAWFFGREQLVGELAARIVGSGALAVIGASGSGKTSVVAAGLLPSLRAGLLPGSSRWTQASMRPGHEPMTALRAAAGSEADDPIGAAIGQLDGGGRLVLVVDQFEEIFTACESAAERAEFLDLLALHAAQHVEQFAVVATMRSDFYGELASYPTLAALFSDNHVLVGPLTRAELHRVVQLPAQRAGVRIEIALVDALVEEAVGEPGALPLLSTALVELWQSRSGGWIRAAAYDEGGGIHGAVARLAEASYGQLDDADQAAAKRVLLRLASSSDGDAATRRRVELEEFDLDRDVSVRRVIERFTADRLLTVSGTTIEVAHEALLREWPRLRGWLEEDVQGRQLRQHLTVAAKGWDAAGRERSELYRGARLTAALEWTADHSSDLNDLERAFVGVSRDASQAEADATRRTNRRLRALLAGAVVLLLVATAAGVVALVQRSSARSAAAIAARERSSANHSATVALANSLGGQAVGEPKLDLAMLLAIEGERLHPSLQTKGALLRTVLRAPTVVRTYYGDDLRVNGMALSPDGRTLALEDNIPNIFFIDTATGRRIGEMPSNDIAGAPSPIGFTPDGKLLFFDIFHSTDLTPNDIDVIDPSTARVTRRLTFPKRVLDAVRPPDDSQPAADFGGANFTFADGGRRLAAAVGGYVVQWAMPQGRFAAKPFPVADSAGWVFYTPDGRRLVVLGSHRTTVLDAHSGRSLRSYPVGGSVAGLSPDGVTMASGDQDGSVHFLDLLSGTVTTSVDAHPGGVNEIDFTPDGKRVITGGEDGVAREWDLATHQVVQTFSGHSGNIFGSAISADGSTYYAGGSDGTVLAWDLTGSRGFGTTFQAMHKDQGWAMDWSPDGSVLATGDAVGTVNLWNVHTLHRIATFRAVPDAVNNVSFSPDGQSLLVQAIRLPPKEGGYLTIWRLHPAPRLVREIPAFFKTPFASYSPDGKVIAATGTPKNAPGGFADPGPGDAQVAEWDAATGKLLAPPIRIRGFGEAFSAGFAAHGTELALGLIHDQVAIVDPAKGRVLRHWKASDAEYVMHAELSPDGTRVASADFDGYVSVWDAATGKRVLPKIRANDSDADWVDWSPDGSKLVTAGGDGTVRLFDARSGQQIGPPLTSSATNFPGVMFSPDGRRTATADSTGRVWIYPVTVEAWAAYACQVANRNLTHAEWSKYVPGYPYQPICPARR